MSRVLNLLHIRFRVARVGFFVKPSSINKSKYTFLKLLFCILLYFQFLLGTIHFRSRMKKQTFF